MRFWPAGFCGVDGVDGGVTGDEDPPPEQALKAMARAVMQTIRIVRGEYPGLNSEAGDAANIDL
jgi:hypothetical protein